MILAVIPKDTLEPVCFIKEYSYCSYTEQYCGRGSFEIHITNGDESLPYLTLGNYIYLDIAKYVMGNGATTDRYIVGIIKAVKNSETSDFEIIVSGYLTNHILEYRSFLKTYKYSSRNIRSMITNMASTLFVNPTDNKRKVNNFSVITRDASDGDFSVDYFTYQNTGSNFLKVLEEVVPKNRFWFSLEPYITPNSNNEIKINNFYLHLMVIADRSIGNSQNNDPVIFSFDLDNISKLDYEMDGREYNNIAIVASEGVGVNRTTLEVGDTSSTGLNRIELYVDARDIQSESDLEAINKMDGDINTLNGEVDSLNEDIGDVEIEISNVSGSLNGYSFGFTQDNKPGYKAPGSDVYVAFKQGGGGEISVEEYERMMFPKNISATASSTFSSISIANGYSPLSLSKE